SLIDSIEKAAKSGKLKISSISDYTAEEVEIEIKLARGIYANDTIKALYAFTDCEVPISPNLTLIKDEIPEISSVSEVLRHNTAKLVADLTRELEIELNRLLEKLHARKLEQIFIEERLYKRIEEEKSYKGILKTIEESLLPYKDELVREVSREDIERLLEIRIKRISRYDIDRQQKEINAINKDIKGVKTSLKDTVSYTVTYINGLLQKYGKNQQRQTELTEFTEVSIRKVALSNLTMVYNRNTGFLGSGLKVEDEKSDIVVHCSEYDKLLLIFNDGVYKVIPVTDKLFVGHDLEWFGTVEKDQCFNIVYRDGQENVSYVKRFMTPKFILDKEYLLFDRHKRSKILLLLIGSDKYARVSLMPSPRAKSNIVEIDFNDYLIKGASAKGKRVSMRVVRRVVEASGLENKQEQTRTLPLPGLDQRNEGQESDSGDEKKNTGE
ncbi:MAG TPA: DNA gyrase subunit A, partial [Desulfopila sp.]|nr:DNA gyrase subunit A [Desulfopila sp.]